MNSKLAGMLGLAAKAGKISLGHDAAVGAVRRGGSELILIASDASDRLAAEFEREIKLSGSKAQIVKTGVSMDEIYTALPVRAGVISINDGGFAAGIKKLLR